VNDEALDKAKAATTELANARKALANAKTLHRMGIATDVTSATMVALSAYERWVAASAIFTGKR
jgi:hypothetical protein